MFVLDASALLAYFQGEPGADVVADNLDDAVIGAANWAEVLQKLRSRQADWEIAAALIESLGVRIEAVSVRDAEIAAAMWRRDSGLSLGDRLCIALATRLDGIALTADRAWGTSPLIRQIR